MLDRGICNQTAGKPDGIVENANDDTPIHLRLSLIHASRTDPSARGDFRFHRVGDNCPVCCGDFSIRHQTRFCRRSPLFRAQCPLELPRSNHRCSSVSGGRFNRRDRSRISCNQTRTAPDVRISKALRDCVSGGIHCRKGSLFGSPS